MSSVTEGAEGSRGTSGAACGHLHRHKLHFQNSEKLSFHKPKPNSDAEGCGLPSAGRGPAVTSAVLSGSSSPLRGSAPSAVRRCSAADSGSRTRPDTRPACGTSPSCDRCVLRVHSSGRSWTSPERPRGRRRTGRSGVCTRHTGSPGPGCGSGSSTRRTLGTGQTVSPGPEPPGTETVRPGSEPQEVT